MASDVLLAPFFSGGNEYMDLLQDNLEEEGLDVATLDTFGPFCLLKAVWSYRPDILHLHWTHPFFLTEDNKTWKSVMAAVLFTIQLLIATILTKRIVWTIHNKHNHEKRHMKIDFIVNKMVARVAERIQVWDEHTKKEAQEYFGIKKEKLVIIPHGNYLPVYPEPKDKADARDQLGLNQDKRILLHFGALRPYKGTVDLVETFNEINPDSAVLIVAGRPHDEDYLDSIEEAADKNDNVILDIGFVEKHKVVEYFSAADIAVFNYTEIFNSGGATLAMSMGKTVAGPRKGMLQSLPAENIIISDTKDMLNTSLAKDSSKVEDIGTINLNSAREDHHWGTTTLNTIKTLYNAQKP